MCDCSTLMTHVMAEVTGSTYVGLCCLNFGFLQQLIVAHDWSATGRIGKHSISSSTDGSRRGWGL